MVFLQDEERTHVEGSKTEDIEITAMIPEVRWVIGNGNTIFHVPKPWQMY